MSGTSVPDQGPQRLEGDAGANLVEYSMLIALIVVVCLSAVTFFGNSATSKMDCAANAVGSLIGGQQC